jgi:hypothetical protein
MAGLSEEMKATLTLYYLHRDNQRTVPWNKGYDLDVIFKAARAEGFSSSASAGQFWFAKPGLRISANEDDYLSGGKVSEEGKPFGFFEETNALLAKSGRAANFINADEHGGLKNALKESIVRKVAEKTEPPKT